MVVSGLQPRSKKVLGSNMFMFPCSPCVCVSSRWAFQLWLIGDSKLNGVNVSANDCLSVCVSPVMNWHHGQGVTRLSPNGTGSSPHDFDWTSGHKSGNECIVLLDNGYKVYSEWILDKFTFSYTEIKQQRSSITVSSWSDINSVCGSSTDFSSNMRGFHRLISFV